MGTIEGKGDAVGWGGVVKKLGVQGANGFFRDEIQGELFGGEVQKIKEFLDRFFDQDLFERKVLLAIRNGDLQEMNLFRNS